MEGNLCDYGFGNGFLDTNLKAQSMKEKNGKLGFIKIKNFCSMMNIVKRLKRQAKEQNKLCANTHFIKDLYRKYITQQQKNKQPNFIKMKCVFFSF